MPTTQLAALSNPFSITLPPSRFSGKECGALPSRRYARKVLKLSPGCRGRARKKESKLTIDATGERLAGNVVFT